MVQLAKLSEKFPSKQNNMTDLELYTKSSALPPEMKKEVVSSLTYWPLRNCFKTSPPIFSLGRKRR
jgi:hypothetical protein